MLERRRHLAQAIDLRLDPIFGKSATQQHAAGGAAERGFETALKKARMLADVTLARTIVPQRAPREAKPSLWPPTASYESQWEPMEASDCLWGPIIAYGVLWEPRVGNDSLDKSLISRRFRFPSDLGITPAGCQQSVWGNSAFAGRWKLAECRIIFTR